MPISVAWKNLLRDRVRFLLSVGGVSLAVMLILILNGFVAGLYRQVSAYLDHAPGDLLVTQEGVTNLLGATSLLPPGLAEEAAQVEGVAQVVPILSQFVILNLHDLKVPAYLIGYPQGDSPAEQRGGPWKLAAGREPRAENEMVFDRVLAERHNLALGDSVELMGTEFEIVGLSDETDSWMTSFFFLRQFDAQKLLRAPGATSILLVSPEPTADAEEVRSRLAGLDGVDALSKETVIANDTKLLVEVFSAPLKLMAGIAFLVGVLVVGLVIYTATVERQREYGVLKAIGARSRLLYQLVIVQALVAAGVGSLAGIGLAVGASEWIMRQRPEFLILLEPEAVLVAISVGVGMSLLAAVVPARVVNRLEPADVFRRGG